MVDRKTNAAVAVCPDCGEKITLRGTIRLGREVICPNCDAELEVVETEPLELDWIYDEEDEEEDEDW